MTNVYTSRRLEVDIGNSFIKWRCGATQSGRFARSDWEDGVGALVSLVPEQILVSSVASESFNVDFGVALFALLGVSPQFAVVKDVAHGLRIAYQDSATLGVDRWLAMLAAKAEFPRANLLVVDAGSAMTADIVLRDGQHVGGVIVPGVGMSFSALGLHTDRVRISTLRLNKNWRPGRSTLDCVQSGVSAMLGGLIAQMINSQSGDDRIDRVVWSGGDATELQSLCTVDPISQCLRTELVLDGLSLAFKNNN